EAEAAARLPHGWQLTPLGQVAQLQPGYAFDSKAYVGDGVRLLRGINIIPGSTRWDDRVCLPMEEIENYREYVLNSGDVVIAMDRPIISTGLKVCVLSQDDLPALLLQRVGRFRQSEAIHPEYLYQFLKSDLFVRYISKQATGTQLPHISANDIESVRIPVPPINEQRRIVAKLADLFARSRSTGEALDAIPPLLDRYRQAVLASAFRGDLTAEWREANPDAESAYDFLGRIRSGHTPEQKRKAGLGGRNGTSRVLAHAGSELPELPPTWAWVPFGELLDRIDAGKSPDTLGRPAEPGEYGVLKISAVTWREFDPQENKAIKDGFDVSGIPTVGAGDLLITRANTAELVGAVAIPRQEYDHLLLSDKTLRLVPASPEIDPYYLMWALRTRTTRDIFEKATGTSNSMRNITQETIRAVPVPLAPEAEARLIVAALNRAEEVTRSVLDAVKEELARLSNFDQAALAKAFRGELVPQDPSDEPASSLLERIKAKQATATVPKAGRGRKPRELAEVSQ
ncbi:MAG: restriction endonuclease subunit S, partial [Cyanobacteria bacterium REEB65]|nr:restriction endonuclease subunit S [Cyanobacteria bacterium REEB65]